MRRRLLLAAVAGLALALPQANLASASKSARLPQVRVLAHANPGGGYSGDIYTHGNYAYLSSWHGSRCPGQGVRVYDVRNPKRPQRVAVYADAASNPLLAGAWTEKTIVQHVATASFTGELAVTSFQSCGAGGFPGFGLYDVTDPSHPRQLSLIRTDPRGSHEIWLNAVGSRAYVYTAIPNSELLSSPDYNSSTGAATIPGKPDFRIFDVSDPGNPVQVGEWGAWKQLRIKPTQGRGIFSANFVHSVITNRAGTRAFLSYWDLGTVILDVSKPARPVYLGRTSFRPGEQGNAHSAALGRSGKLLIETHETPLGTATLYDIANPRRPVRLSVFKPPAAILRSTPNASQGFTGSVHDPKIRGNRAFFSWYGLGVLVADISKPRNPRFVARFRPSSSTDPESALCRPDPRCEQIWGVYPDGNVVYASGMVGGLWVFQLR